MKAKKLILLFTTKERQLFEQTVIKTHKRKRLKKLYQELKKVHTATKEVLFERVFESPYQETKDASLRNELRLLSNAIELFWVQQRQLATLNLQQYETKFSLLQVYIERGQWSFFDQLWQRVYKTAIQEHQYQQQIELLHLWLQHKMTTGENSIAWLEMLQERLQQAQIAVQALFQEQSQRLQVKQGFVERNLVALNPRYEAQLPALPNTTILPNQEAIHFLSLVAESYLLYGTQKIEQLEKALEFSPFLKAHQAYQDLYQSTVSVQGNIAIEYFLQKDYVAADAAYTTLLTQIKNLPSPKKTAILFNYMVNLICLGNYQQALTVYEENALAFSENELFKYRVLYFKAWCYILEGAYAEALDLVLESKPQDRPHHDSIYGRILLSILYSMLGELELAERELYNLKQKHQYNPLQEPFSLDCVTLFYKFVQLQFLPPSDKKLQKIEQLRQEMQSRYNQDGNSTRSTLLLRWFEQVTTALLEAESR
ncbi:MAG: hypothetical protein ACRBFS_17845 [Aureispira sp.]